MKHKKPSVVIAGFGDEYSYHALEHLEFLGRRSIPISVRFFSFNDEARLENLDHLTHAEFQKALAGLKADGHIKHITAATDEELGTYQRLIANYGVKVWDIGSALGKQYLGDPNDVDNIPRVLENTIKAAKALKTQRIRMFNFYPGTRDKLEQPGTDGYKMYHDLAVELVQAIGANLKKEGLAGYLEVEANLLGNNGANLMEFYNAVNCPNIVLYFDGANMVIQDAKKQGLSLQAYSDMIDGIGGFHIKDAKYSELATGSHTNEEVAWPFVPVGQGDAAYDKVFESLWMTIDSIRDRLIKAGLPPEVGVVQEPHQKCGGQFGGFTGSRYTVANQALTRLLDAARIQYQDISFK